MTDIFNCTLCFKIDVNNQEVSTFVCFYIDVFTTADTLRVWAVEENNNTKIHQRLIITEMVKDFKMGNVFSNVTSITNRLNIFDLVSYHRPEIVQHMLSLSGFASVEILQRRHVKQKLISHTHTIRQTAAASYNNRQI